MDKFDCLILNELLKDAQMSFSAIARKLGTTPYTIRKRYEQMKQDGTIFSSVISVDLAKIGYQGKVFLMITNAPNQEKTKTIQDLAKIKNIISISEIVGSFDVLAIAPIMDFNSIMDLVKKVKALPSVQQVETTFIKNTAFPVNAEFGAIMAKYLKLNI